MHSTRRQTSEPFLLRLSMLQPELFILEHTNRSMLAYSSSLLINWESFLGPEDDFFFACSLFSPYISRCCMNVWKSGFRYFIIHWNFLLNYIPYRALHTWFRGLHIHRFQFTSPLLHNFPLQSCICGS